MNDSEILIYQAAAGKIKIDVRLEDETVWLTQDHMAGLFGKAKSTINEHIKNIFAEGELVEAEVMKKFGISEFQQKAPNYYNLDVIIDSAGESRKIPARNHQFLGVNRAIEAVRDRKHRSGKLGVFWHTQGSGKSCSMVLFTRKVHRKLSGNFTFPILTDRDDLMNFPEQPQRQRQSFIQQAQAVVESGDIVADLLVYRLFRKRKR